MRNNSILLALALFLASSCSGTSSPEVQPGPDGSLDPVLVSGRDLYGSNCTSCHGASGGGTSRAPRLDGGRVVEQYSDMAELIEFVADGRSGMPPFSGKLDASEIEAVVRYTYEVIDKASS